MNARALGLGMALGARLVSRTAALCMRAIAGWVGMFRCAPNAAIGASLLTLIGGAALIGQMYTPYDPTATDFLNRFQPPSAEHWLGTDQYGSDVLSRLLSGLFVSLRVSLLSTVIAVIAGTALGGMMGYFRGWLDRALTMVIDALMAFPGLLLVLGIVAVMTPSTAALVCALGLAFTPAVTRVVRSTVLSLREREFVEASRLNGNSEAFTLVRHVLPNCMSAVLAIGTSLFAYCMLAETSLSFLGLGVPPPLPSLGGMLADSREYLDSAAWLAIFPGVTVSVTLLGVNLLGDALRDRWDTGMTNLR